MRLLVLLLCSLSFSSCLAIGLGALITTATAAGTSSDARKGAEREARQRAQDAREAAVIRKRYNEAEARSRAEAPQLPVPALPAQLTPPPLVQLEPARTPLRPR